MSFIVEFCVKHHQFHVFQTFLHRLFRPDKGSPPRIFILSRNLEYWIVFINLNFISLIQIDSLWPQVSEQLFVGIRVNRPGNGNMNDPNPYK